MLHCASSIGLTCMTGCALSSFFRLLGSEASAWGVQDALFCAYAQHSVLDLHHHSNSKLHPKGGLVLHLPSNSSDVVNQHDSDTASLRHSMTGAACLLQVPTVGCRNLFSQTWV